MLKAGARRRRDRCLGFRADASPTHPYPARRVRCHRIPTQGRDNFGSQVSVVQVSGTGLQVRVRVRVLNLDLVLNT
jgi:hypothetical protein